MITSEQNLLMTRAEPGTPAGKLLRMYWRPAALVDQLQGPRPVKAVRLLGEELVLSAMRERTTRWSSAIVHIAVPTWPMAGSSRGDCAACFTGGCSILRAGAWR